MSKEDKIKACIATDFISHITKTDWGFGVSIMHKNGIAFARLYQYADDTETVVLCSLSVDENVRKQGIGTKLQQMRENIGIVLGASRSCLWVKNKTWMRNWYERRGYTYLEDYKGEEDSIWMVKSLK